jgi:hypothetical protein
MVRAQRNANASMHDYLMLLDFMVELKMGTFKFTLTSGFGVRSQGLLLGSLKMLFAGWMCPGVPKATRRCHP